MESLTPNTRLEVTYENGGLVLGNNITISIVKDLLGLLASSVNNEGIAGRIDKSKY